MKKKVLYFLKKYPNIKKLLKFLYYFIFYPISLLNNRFILNPVFKIKQINVKKGEDTFFGYYDKSPLNSSGRKLLVNSYSKKGFYVNVIEEGSVLFRVKTNIHNLQQGVMSQWLDNETIIYNDEKQGVLGAYIVNINTEEIRFIKYPVQSYNETDVIASINYTRLQKYRPDYGYKGTFSNFYPDMEFSNDGLWLFDIKRDKVITFVSLLKILKVTGLKTLDISRVRINHCMFNSNRKSIVFLLRVQKESNEKTYLLNYSIEGDNLKTLVYDRWVSHYAFHSDDMLIAWIGFRSSDYFKNGFYKINLKTGSLEMINSLSNLGDGHPSFFKNKMVYDSYPNKFRRINLNIYDFEENKKEHVGSFFSPIQFFEQSRCDLHPRFINEDLICIDSAHTGKRKMYLISK